MGNLKYATFRNENHHGTVRTWVNSDGIVNATITVDGTVLFDGEVSDDDE